MKINEVTNIEEAPVGGLKQLGRELGAKAANRIPGMRNIASNLAGKADMGRTANNLFKQFNTYLGTQNKTFNTATGSDLIDFLKTKRVDTSGYFVPFRTKLPRIKGLVDDIMLDVAQKALGGPGSIRPSSGQGAPGADGDQDSSGPDADDDQDIDPNTIEGKLSRLIGKMDDTQKEKLLRLLRQN